MLQNSKEDIFLYYKHMAEQGDVAFQYNLGRCYEKGEGVKQNIQKAIFWYKKSAEQGNNDAQIALQALYNNGYGMQQGSNNKYSSNNVSKLPAHIESLLQAANKGDMVAQFNLGIAYAHHSSGIEIDYKKAVYWYRKAAEQGHAEAQFLLGLSYLHGRGLDKDDRLGLLWYRKSANQGFARAQYELGSFYENGNHVEKDYNCAMRWYEKAAKQGYADAESQYQRCVSLINGDGQNAKRSVFLYYENMAKQGYTLSQYTLGKCYEEGEGVKQDIQKAIFWYKKAAEQGNSNAKNRLQDLYSKGYGMQQGSNNKYSSNNASKLPAHIESLLQAANKGDMVAQFNLGIAYANFSSGIPTDESKSVYWYRKAAEQGHAEAQFLLGLSYLHGYGLDKDDRLGLLWYRKSANQGFARAQYELGSFYENGNHVEKDYNCAMRWYEKAAKQGYADAESQYQRCVSLINGDGQNAKRSVFLYYENMAKQGYALSQYTLGKCYEEGEGVKQDIQKAIFWYKKAAEQGNSNAKDRLQDLYPEHHNGEQSTSNIVEKENKEENSKSKVESKESKAENESKNNVLQKTTSISTNLLGKMKKEAIKRMIVMRISSEVIYKFANNDTLCVSYPPNGSFYEAEEEDLKHIKEFEEQHNALVYSVVRCQTNYGLMDNFLYVSSMTLDWDEERAAIENSKACAYSYNHDNPNISELSLIGIQRTIASGLIRTL